MPPTEPPTEPPPGPPTDLTVRPVLPSELPEVTALHVAARDAAYPFMPRTLHPPRPS